jgi:hypothetical protein
MQHHRHQEFIRFLNAVEAQVPAGRLVHASAAATKQNGHCPSCGHLWSGRRCRFDARQLAGQHPTRRPVQSTAVKYSRTIAGRFAGARRTTASVPAILCCWSEDAGAMAESG